MLIPIFNSEVEVQFFYTKILCDLLKCNFSARFRCDGIYDSKDLKILGEYKFDLDLTKRNLLTKCICQAIAYIKLVERAGEKLPNLLFIGSDKNFSIVRVVDLQDCISIVPENISPSSIFQNPPKNLFDKVNRIARYVYKISRCSELGDILNQFKDCGEVRLRITDENLCRIFEDFISSNIIKTKLEVHEYAALFVSILFEECYNVEGREDLIITPLEKRTRIKVDREGYDLFLNSIRTIQRLSSKDDLVSKLDVLIEEDVRRFLGEFYTPRVWVDEAHREIESVLGIDWKEKFVVWDPCCGTGNLTKDYRFKELYCSTLHQSDIDIMEQRYYNPEAVKFQYDFLNDDISRDGLMTFENKLDEKAPSLIESLESGKPLVFLMNPPFGTAASAKIRDSKTKDKISDTRCGMMMYNEKLGTSKQQLFSHFLYRIILFSKKYPQTKFYIATFSSSRLLDGKSLRKLRNLLSNFFSYKSGFIFSSTYFSSIKSEWPVLFSVWIPEPEDAESIFDVTIKELDGQKVKNIRLKKLYNTDFLEPLVDWYKEGIDLKEKVESVVLANPLKPNKTRTKESTLIPSKNFLGIFGDGLSVGSNSWNVLILSASYLAGGFPIVPENFYKVCASFTAKKTIKSEWFNCNDEYLKPNIEHPDYPQWERDSVVYTLVRSGVSSMRRVPFEGKFWDVKNEFFWLSRKFMLDLANENNFSRMHRDAKVSENERFVYQQLQNLKLSPDAREVLNLMTEIVVKTIQQRKDLSEKNPELHLYCWDAGWYQISKLFDFIEDKELLNLIDKFQESFRLFENRMRQGVYKFRFLIK